MSQTSDPVVIAAYARTPMGGFQGLLSGAKATDLGAAAVRAAVERSGAPGDAIEQILMGCVLPAGLGQAPARQAALGAGLPKSVQATTVNKMCGSGMQAAILAHDALAAGSVDVIVAGGMESMTNAPYLMTKHRGGARIGHDTMYDHMYLDGLEDAYEPGRLMGSFAEETAKAYQFTREAQDEYAIGSLTKARAATESGAFAREIVAVTVTDRKGSTVVDKDEQPLKADPAKIPTLKPAFAKDGTITAANASSISDGAAALVMTRESVARKLGMKIVARVAGHAAHAHEPGLFTTAPVPAVQKTLKRAGWGVNDVDLFEINEAFAVVAMIAERDLGIDRAKLNVNGGACALGHPIGASGARILATLLSALEARGGKRGVASLCIGGGEATAMAVELV
ncbi:MAG: acetyl-CoA C-acyltransferase [Alphaproteobacteria bacterium]|nr:acetyl-CoA C-acyltransferase [Alphaproteobacteria bacterium]MBU1513414.1 acetyl-CoA C-acyltransferase [Alphaproteobacteria bacterium]MBU2096406.1 acetyl-CoA C-acyltransferase [Alphaproteobacteria bacterium]MBU2149902.1 acetyl-CoA C-acyltransferase [Alphaproteobacteria bacterium]MBU2308192.1 acetyl-CoA C-acyltransferase [Alphaproteobacteria bacterium]